MDKNDFKVIEHEVTFGELIDEKTKEKLLGNEEHKDILRNLNEANILYSLGFKFYSKSFTDEQTITEADIAQMKKEIEEFDEKKKELEAKLAKAKLFKKKLRNKLFELEKNNHVNKSYLEKIEKYEALMERIGESSIEGIEVKLKNFEREVVRTVLLENFENHLVQNMIEALLEKGEALLNEEAGYKYGNVGKVILFEKLEKVNKEKFNLQTAIKEIERGLKKDK